MFIRAYPISFLPRVDVELVLTAMRSAVLDCPPALVDLFRIFIEFCGIIIWSGPFG